MRRVNFNEYLKIMCNDTFDHYRGIFNAEPEKKEKFKRNYEDLVANAIITCSTYSASNIGLEEGKTSLAKALEYALESIDIVNSSKAHYDTNLEMVINRENYCAAKRNMLEREIKSIGFRFQDYVGIIANYRKYPNLSEMLNMGFSMLDRKSGYCEDPEEKYDVANKCKEIWQSEKEYYKSFKKGKSFTYYMLDKIYSDKKYHHYSEIEKEVIKRMCNISNELDNFNSRDIKPSYVRETFKKLKLAAKINPEVMNDIKNHFKLSIKDHITLFTNNRSSKDKIRVLK